MNFVWTHLESGVPVWNWSMTPTFAACLLNQASLHLHLHHVVFFPHSPWVNWIFWGNSPLITFSLTKCSQAHLAWLLSECWERADESDCRGVLITQKLSAADRRLYFFFKIIKPLPLGILPSTEHATCSVHPSRVKAWKDGEKGKKKPKEP